MSKNPFVGSWTYRSFLNDPDISKDVDKLLFGEGTIVINKENSEELLTGTIGGTGWGPLYLHGSRSYGSPMQVRFQGKGLQHGEEWVYDYIGWLVPTWPNSNETLQVDAIVGSVVRTVPHSSSDSKAKGPKAVEPAGVVASFYAVRSS
jgi:hypothetical protein